MKVPQDDLPQHGFGIVFDVEVHGRRIGCDSTTLFPGFVGICLNFYVLAYTIQHHMIFGCTYSYDDGQSTTKLLSTNDHALGTLYRLRKSCRIVAQHMYTMLARTGTPL